MPSILCVNKVKRCIVIGAKTAHALVPSKARPGQFFGSTSPLILHSASGTGMIVPCKGRIEFVEDVRMTPGHNAAILRAVSGGDDNTCDMPGNMTIYLRLEGGGRLQVLEEIAERLSRWAKEHGEGGLRCFCPLLQTVLLELRCPSPEAAAAGGRARALDCVDIELLVQVGHALRASGGELCIRTEG
eukprot:3935999-Rhodomonas_salina.2